MANASTAVNAATTSNLFTVDNIAAKWITQTATGVQKKREIFNLKAAWFNIATIATIVSIALTIFTGSIALAALAWLAWNVREAVFKAVILTGSRESPAATALFERLEDIVEEGTTMQIRDYLDISEPNWNHIHSQILDFTIWMNQVSLPVQPAAPRGAQSASNASAPAAPRGAQNASNAPASAVGGDADAAQVAEEHDEEVDASQELPPGDVSGDEEEVLSLVD